MSVLNLMAGGALVFCGWLISSAIAADAYDRRGGKFTGGDCSAILFGLALTALGAFVWSAL